MAHSDARRRDLSDLDPCVATTVCPCGVALAPVHALCSCGTPLCLECAQQFPRGCQNLGHGVQKRNTWSQTVGDDRAVIERKSWSNRVCAFNLSSLLPEAPVLDFADSIITRGRFWHMPKASIAKVADALDASLNLVKANANKTYWAAKIATWCGRKGDSCALAKGKDGRSGNAIGHLCFIIHAFCEFNCTIPCVGGYSSYAFGGLNFVFLTHFYRTLRQALAGIETKQKYVKALIAAFDLLFAYTPLDPFGLTGIVDGKLSSSHIQELRTLVRQRNLTPFLRHEEKMQRGDMSFRDVWRGKRLFSAARKEVPVKPLPRVAVEVPRLPESLQLVDSLDRGDEDSVPDDWSPPMLFVDFDDEEGDDDSKDTSEYDSVITR
eukprot:GEMP01055711.1.p1 GENE.GEMP01055711.1~~GEMP01055711.1.p1  ORF type:complete len:379 (+),score=79.81 GEMP01055711.1:108-1244(+)